jgi:hypothetical protein
MFHPHRLIRRVADSAMGRSIVSALTAIGWNFVEVVGQRYDAALNVEKTEILDEFAAVAEYPGKHDPFAC